MLGPWFNAIIHVMLGLALAGTLGQHRGTPHGVKCRSQVLPLQCTGALQCSADNGQRKGGQWDERSEGDKKQ